MHLGVNSIGEAWIGVARAIMTEGSPSTYDGLSMRELIMVTLEVAHPAGRDRIIERYADVDRLAWMHANFVDVAIVSELGDADSYATRLGDYAHSGRDQLAWVVERLKADPLSRSATITTLQPLTDTSYVPCVSLLDFFLDAAGLNLVVYAHSIDFGAKGYANLVELAAILENVGSRLTSPLGSVTMIVKSAHVYDTDVEYLSGVLDQQSR